MKANRRKLLVLLSSPSAPFWEIKIFNRKVAINLMKAKRRAPPVKQRSGLRESAIVCVERNNHVLLSIADVIA